jgi:hypothetical protein
MKPQNSFSSMPSSAISAQNPLHRSTDFEPWSKLDGSEEDIEENEFCGFIVFREGIGVSI